MRKIFLTVFGFWLGCLLLAARADTLPLEDGSSLTGDIIKFDDKGLLLRQSDNAYTNVLWTKFSQAGLKQLAKNPKIEPFVEPFIEIPLSARPQKPEVKIEPVERLALPPKQSLFGALFSSSIGVFALLLIYGANIYAGYEIAIIRIRPKGLVMGVAAVLPILGPIIFLALPSHVEPAPVEELVEADPATFAVPGQPAAAAEEIHVGEVTPGSHPAPKSIQSFHRGQFTFNRRFIETKFAGFIGATRGAADANNLLILKAVSGQFTVERIKRVAANEMLVEVALGEVRQEVTIPFIEIQEIQIKPKTG